MPAPVTAHVAEPVIEPPELFVTEYDDDDRYRLSFDDHISRSSRIYLYVTLRSYYAIDCQWQGDTCTGYLPREARGARILLIREKYMRCPGIHLEREGVELVIEEPFLTTNCAFVLRTAMSD